MANGQQTMLQQLSNPLAVDLVGFPPRHILDVMRIHQKQPELLLRFQDVPYRFPINPGCFHRNPLHSQAR
jgi:hypothetical protein